MRLLYCKSCHECNHETVRGKGLTFFDGDRETETNLVEMRARVVREEKKFQI